MIENPNESRPVLEGTFNSIALNDPSGEVGDLNHSFNNTELTRRALNAERHIKRVAEAVQDRVTRDEHLAMIAENDALRQRIAALETNVQDLLTRSARAA